MVTSDERKLLIRKLTAVLSTGVWEAFLTNPILGAGAIPFPEAMDGEEQRLGFLLLYLLDHVGLNEVKLHLEAWTLDPQDVVPNSQPYEPVGSGTSLAYAGSKDGACLVVYDPKQLDNPTSLLGAAGLVVGEIYRSRSKPNSESAADADLVEAELEAVALGFGVLLANASFHVRSWQEHQSSVTRTSTQGQLGPERLGYLLALQLTAREAGEESIEHVRRGLAASPVDAFDTALEQIDEATVALLDLPTRNKWPVTPLADHRDVDMRRLTVLRNSATHRREIRETHALRNQEHPVFRVPSDRTPITMLKAAMAGLPALIALSFLGVPALGVLALLLAAGGGFVYARGLRIYECSDQDCMGRLDHDMQRCPECGGLIAGDIEHADARLAAEEKWLEEHRPDRDEVDLQGPQRKALAKTSKQQESTIDSAGYW